MMSNLRITLTITNLRVFFKSSLIAKIMRSFKLIIAQLLRPKSPIWDFGLEFSNSEAPL